MGMSWTETRAFLSTMRGLLPVQTLTVDIRETGLALAERYGLSTCDSMIAVSALHADCDTLWFRRHAGQDRARQPPPHRQSFSRSITLRHSGTNTARSDGGKDLDEVHAA
jgi:hypothetical protein